MRYKHKSKSFEEIKDTLRNTDLYFLIQEIEWNKKQLSLMYDENYNLTEKMVEMVEELQNAKEEIKRIKIGSDIFSKGNAHCEECHYDTGWLGMNDLIFKLSLDGGYLISDKEGGYFSKCPKCESDNLSLES